MLRGKFPDFLSVSLFVKLGVLEFAVVHIKAIRRFNGHESGADFNKRHEVSPDTLGQLQYLFRRRKQTIRVMKGPTKYTPQNYKIVT